MSDLSAKIAEMLHEGSSIASRGERNEVPGIVDLILERYPHASSDEIVRGFQISMELLKLEEAEAMVEGRR